MSMKRLLIAALLICCSCTKQDAVLDHSAVRYDAGGLFVRIWCETESCTLTAKVKGSQTGGPWLDVLTYVNPSRAGACYSLPSAERIRFYVDDLAAGTVAYDVGRTSQACAGVALEAK